MAEGLGHERAPRAPAHLGERRGQGGIVVLIRGRHM
jgi:hypothetical protein